MLASVIVDDKLRELSKDESIEPYEPEFAAIIESQPLAKEVRLSFTSLFFSFLFFFLLLLF